MGGVSNGGGGQNSAFTADHNLTAVPTPGANNLSGLPVFRGPLRTYAGYRLAPGSPGVRHASDGTDAGIRATPSVQGRQRVDAGRGGADWSVRHVWTNG